VALTLGLWLFSWCVAPHHTWARVGFSTADADLVREGNWWGGLWLDASQYFRDHAPQGAVIAYTEMGYGPYMNPDKKFIDLGGLVDKQIAHADDKYKTDTGVSTQSWYYGADSPLLVFLQQRKPLYVVYLCNGLSKAKLPDYDLEKMLLARQYDSNIFTPIFIYRYHPQQTAKGATPASPGLTKRHATAALKLR
jgi:hypothetical protein